MADISAIKLPNGNTYDLVDRKSGFVTTDEKLVINQENSNNTYYPIISTSSTAASTKYIDTRGIRLDITNGTERSQGDITLVLGNPTAVNYDGNKAGFLQLYSLYSGYAQIQTSSSLTSNIYLTLPSSTGTLALTSNIKDATLTIQKNGVNVETFSANASSNVTANITVPTKVSDLTNDSGFVTTDTKHTAGITEVNSSQIQGGIYLIGTDTPPTSGSEYSRTYTYPSKLYVDSGSGLHTPTGLVIHDPYSNYKVAFAHDTLTENRTYVFPNKTGYVALTSDIPNVSGKIDTAGTGLSKSGTTLNHSNSITAQTTLGIYPIKIDAQGHITEYGTAVTIPTKTSDLTNDSGFITGMTILSYGSSTWQNFIDAYNANKVVYCRASSNSNPASGSQTRLAFMAYVNNATTPTEVEFQYYRSVSTHTASQQGDQVYVYKLNKTNGWSVTVREASVKVVAGTGLSGTYSNGTMTLTAPHDTTKQDILVSGTNIKTINNTSLLGSGDITISAENEIFVCEYGVTTFADVLVAHNAGKRLVCHYNNSLLDFYAWLEAYDSENTYFEFEVTSGDKHMEFYLDSSGWTRDEYAASSIPIARRISKFNSDARMNSMDMTSSEIEDFVEDLDMGASGLLNMFYPIGSYYETSDSTFDPNIRWGGTWVLEIEGQVHVSAGVNYEIGDTGGEAEVTLTTSEIPAHTHGSKSLTGTLTSRRQGANYISHWGSGIVSISAGGANVASNGVGTSNQNADIATINATHEHDSVGDGGAHNNMPPYVVVNRWHRTA